MEKQYNQLLALSKTVSAFYENVYAPVMQTLPWLVKGDDFKVATEKVLGNLAFPAYEISSYKNKPESPETMAKLRARCNDLESIHKKMQDELQPLLDKIPEQDRTWKKLQEMVPEWQKLNSSDELPYNVYRAVEKSYNWHRSAAKELLVVPSGGPTVSSSDDLLGKLMAEKIKSLRESGEGDVREIFGSHGLWLAGSFLHRLR